MSDLTISPVKAQSYSVFVYNSSGSQSGNTFSSWSDLMTATQAQAGIKTIIFQQNETIPAGAWNLDNTILRGNRADYDAGGYTVTFGDSTTITSWINPAIDGIRILSTSTTGPIWTTAVGFNFDMSFVSSWHGITEPFIESSASGQHVFALSKSARFQRLPTGDVEQIHFTGAAFGPLLILGRFEGATVSNNLASSVNAIVLIDVLNSSAQASMNVYPTTRATETIGATIQVKYPLAIATVYDPTTSGLIATTVQGAIDEIADPTDAYTPTNVTLDRSYDANATTTAELADVVGTLIADLQDRSIIG